MAASQPEFSPVGPMQSIAMKRWAAIASAAILAACCAAPMAVAAAPERSGFRLADSNWSEPARRPYRPVGVRKRNNSNDRQASRQSETHPIVPPGPLQIIVSIDKQNVTLFAGGVKVANSAISSGTPSHPTPMGVFSVVQKRRHHISNLYYAPMPYMQRLTWSGTAMHLGPLPGRPASHGCIRLPESFAQLLWTITKIGARVIITRDAVAPVDIKHVRLFTPMSKIADSLRGSHSPDSPLETKPIKTADATIALSGTDPNASKPTDPLTASDKDRPATGKIVNRRAGPVSVFISRQEGKVYVRQAMEPLFDAPITIDQPEQPLGTHVYTAMGLTNDADAMRWTVVSIPSSFKPAVSPKNSESGKKPRNSSATMPAVAEPPPPSASAALDRIVLPADAVERIAELIAPGSSLIVSDNKLSAETGWSTDFIVLTR